MPCYDDRSDSSPRDCSGEIALARAEFRHNSDVAEMLCKVLTDFEAEQRYLKERGTSRDPYPETVQQKYGADIAQWWQEHKKRDAAIAQEEARKKELRDKRRAAVAKLTAEERRLLGLNR